MAGILWLKLFLQMVKSNKDCFDMKILIRLLRYRNNNRTLKVIIVLSRGVVVVTTKVVVCITYLLKLDEIIIITSHISTFKLKPLSSLYQYESTGIVSLYKIALDEICYQPEKKEYEETKNNLKKVKKLSKLYSKLLPCSTSEECSP